MWLNHFVLGLTRLENKPRYGVVANSLDLFRNGAVGFTDWLDGWRGLVERCTQPSNNASCLRCEAGQIAQLLFAREVPIRST